MLVIIIVSLFRAAAGAASAIGHVLIHAVAWLINPDVARYGACVNCSDERASAAYAKREAAHATPGY